MSSKKKSNPKIKWIIGLTIACLLAAALMCSYRYYLNHTKAVSQNDEAVAFTVAEGSSMNDIIDQLYDCGLINEKNVAKIFVKLNKLNDYYAGNYVLHTNMSMKEIFDYIGVPTNAITEQAIVTIAPGYWAKDAAAAIAEKTNLTAEEILAKWNDVSYIYTLIDKYEVLTEDIFNSEHCYLEGYIFPETYYFYASTTVEQVTEKILDQTEAIYEKYKDQFASSKYSIHQIFTFASVVLFEANNEEDMKLVASVFYNRFAKGMQMQSSVTVCYALYDYDSWVDCERNTTIDSKYNTYKVEGLPVGPVCNPTEVAIKAVLEPAESDYYYFVADLNSGKCIFAKTYAEHLQNCQKYLGY